MFFLSTFVSAQNLVPNPSFEDTTSLVPSGIWSLWTCKTANCKSFVHCLNWFNPTQNSPDFYNTWSYDTILGAPKNQAGYQSPHTGHSYAGGGAYEEYWSNREYIEVQLISPLKSGKNYNVSFYVSRGGKNKYGVDGMGAYLSADTCKSKNLLNLPFKPQIENPPGNILNDTLNWTLISGTFTASGGEQFITIGNFNDNPHTMVDSFNYSSGLLFYGYYYIDDVSVTPATSDDGISELSNSIHFTIYPNPSSGLLTIQLPQSSFTYSIQLINLLGQPVFTQNKIQSPTFTLDISTIPKSVYIMLVRQSTGLVGRQRVVVE